MRKREFVPKKKENANLNNLPKQKKCMQKFLEQTTYL